MSYLDNHKIDELKSRIDILDVVSERVQLKKSGQNWVGLCPFHEEKTPSFMVSPSKQIFHCFGCHVGGDIIAFLMRYDHSSFIEVVDNLAKRTGINIQISKEPSEKQKNKALLLDILKEAIFFYGNNLNKNQKVVDYLEKRGIHKDTCNSFSLGFASAGRNSLYVFLKNKGYKEKMIREAGLIGQHRCVDLFRNRVIIPIVNVTGEAIALGGRVLDDSMPKYLNSPETHVFNKRKILYGFNNAVQDIRKRGFLILVEGYFDVLMSHQYGFNNTVAPLGTSLTEDQGKLISRYTDNVILVFDGDDAGIRAAKRGFDILLKIGIDAKALILPKKEDPDSILRKKGPEAYAKLLDKAVTLSNFFSKLSEQKSLIIKDVLEIISKIPDKVLQGLHIKELSETFNIHERFLIDALSRQDLRKKEIISNVDMMQNDRKKPKEELYLLSVILQKPLLANLLFESLSVDDFIDETISTILKKIRICNIEDEDKLIHTLLQEVNVEMSNLLTELSMTHSTIKEPERILKHCINKIKEKKNRKERLLLQEKIKEAEKKNDTVALRKLLSEKMRLLREIRHD